ncbi:hypothetical protein KY285_000864 [Solanum tuberosum]|nr:hypothetical protein KY285_000864 [Solanum tuberosum]
MCAESLFFFIGKALSIEAGSSRPSAVGPFESLAEELRVVRELATKLPQGPGETSAGHNSLSHNRSLTFSWRIKGSKKLIN